MTGEPLTSQQRRANSGATVSVKTFAVLPDDRDALADRIEQRFDEMVTAGFVEEVEKFKARGDLSPATPAIRES